MIIMVMDRRRFLGHSCKGLASLVIAVSAVTALTTDFHCGSNNAPRKTFVFPRERYREVDGKDLILSALDVEISNPFEGLKGYVKVTEQLRWGHYSFNESAKKWHNIGLGDTRMMPYKLNVCLEETDIVSGSTITNRDGKKSYVYPNINVAFCFYDREDLYLEVFEKLEKMKEKMEKISDYKPQITVYGYFNGKKISPSHVIGFDDGVSGYKEYGLSNEAPGYYGSTEEIKGPMDTLGSGSDDF